MASSTVKATATRAALVEGCRRFDDGRFFEAHEVWEDAWRVEASAVRTLLQGLIQIAAAFHKGWVQGRPSGMAKLLGAGIDRISAAGGAGLVEIDGVVTELATWRSAARRWAEGGERPALPLPRLVPALKTSPG